MRSRAEWGRRSVRIASAALVAVLITTAAACGSDETDARPVVEVFGPIVGDSGATLAEVLRDASAEATVELRYVGVTSFNEQLEDRLAVGNRPAIALLSQPGVLHDLADRGFVVPLPDDVATSSADQYSPRLVELVSDDGVPTAIWLTVDVKGLVWYQPAEFNARALDIPATLDDLAELSDRIRTEAGPAPWCLTMAAGASTGWVGTDWVEDYVLRRLGPSDYARWTTGEIRFDSPDIENVFAELDTLLRAPGAVAGGQRTVLTVPWERTADLVTAASPRCLMAHQGDFLRREFGSTTIGPDGDIDFFPLPGSTIDSSPLLVGGLLAAPFADTPEVATAMAILGSVDVAERLDRASAFLSPHLDVDPAVFDDDPTSARLLDVVRTRTDLHFDGSDLMPASVGTDTFWAGMRSFFAGEPIDTILPAIDARWSAPTGS